MTDRELRIAAFAKMVSGEPLSLKDAQRVWETVLTNGLNIDSGNEQAVAQFVGTQLKPTLHQRFFSE